MGSPGLRKRLFEQRSTIRLFPNNGDIEQALPPALKPGFSQQLSLIRFISQRSLLILFSSTIRVLSSLAAEPLYVIGKGEAQAAILLTRRDLLFRIFKRFSRDRLPLLLSQRHRNSSQGFHSLP